MNEDCILAFDGRRANSNRHTWQPTYPPAAAAAAGRSLVFSSCIARSSGLREGLRLRLRLGLGLGWRERERGRKRERERVDERERR